MVFGFLAAICIPIEANSSFIIILAISIDHLVGSNGNQSDDANLLSTTESSGKICNKTQLLKAGEIKRQRERIEREREGEGDGSHYSLGNEQTLG